MSRSGRRDTVDCIEVHIRIASLRYYEYEARERTSDRLPGRQRLELDIQRVCKDNFQVYGTRKVWRQLLQTGIGIARDTVERLMKRLEIQGVRRGAKCKTTLASDVHGTRRLRSINKIGKEACAAQRSD